LAGVLSAPLGWERPGLAARGRSVRDSFLASVTPLESVHDFRQNDFCHGLLAPVLRCAWGARHRGRSPGSGMLWKGAKIGIAERLEPNLSSTSGRSFTTVPSGKCKVFAAKDPIVAFSRACPAVKPVREPDAGDPQVRFDERRWETELRPRLRHRHPGESRRQQLLPRPTDTAPAADSTPFPPPLAFWKREQRYGVAI
jgi:hypothetical protein